MNPTPFPPYGAKSFALRFDFAIELGFLEEARAPVCKDSYEELRFRDPRYADIALEDYNFARSRFSLPRFLSYFEGVAPGQTVLRPWIVDSWVLFSPVELGLWGEMISKASHVHSHISHRSLPICAVPLEKPIFDWTLPDHCVVHDTRVGIAAVITWEAGRAFLDLNGQS